VWTYVSRNHKWNNDLISININGEQTRQIMIIRHSIRQCNSFLRQSKGLRIVSSSIAERSCLKIGGSRYHKSTLSQTEDVISTICNEMASMFSQVHKPQQTTPNLSINKVYSPSILHYRLWNNTSFRLAMLTKFEQINAKVHSLKEASSHFTYVLPCFYYMFEVKQFCLL
jgi:hypothetical protein